MLELHTLLNERALKNVKIQSLGPVYERLCNDFPLQPIQRESHHKIALKVLTTLSEYLTNQKPKEKKQILNYMDALGLLVEEFERQNFSRESEKISGIEVLATLMEQHDLTQTKLVKELGSQSIVSELLSGKRKLNNHQIMALSKRFGVSPAVFFPI